MIKNICVYCSSYNNLDEHYYEEARTLGRLMAENNYGLVYGGGNVGLMGVIAREVHENNGFVYGVIPWALKNREGIAYEIADELVVTETMRERKGIMFEQSQAFITLAGGMGTLEELMETLTLRQLGYHDHPIIIVNTNGFYDPLLSLFEHFKSEKVVRNAYTSLFKLVDSAEEAITWLQKYQAAL